MFKKSGIQSGDIFGGLASMLVAFPASIAFGIIIFSPLGPDYAVRGAIAGITGIIIIGLIAPLAGGSPGLVSSPCAPAAAVLSAFVIEMSGNGGLRVESIPSMIMIIIVLCGIIQIIIGMIGAGRFIKYIPYSVVSGYLSSVGLLIITGQIPNLFGFGKAISSWQGIISPGIWHWKGLLLGAVTMIFTVGALRFVKRFPATIIGLLSGIAAYWIMALYNPEMTSHENNPMVLGAISGKLETILSIIKDNWNKLSFIESGNFARMAVTAGTLSILLSIDSLKSCLALEAMTRMRGKSNRELVGQGIANFGSALAGGVAGAGVMGATMINISSGGRSRLSGVLVGAFSLAALLFLSDLIAWIPLPALAGILAVIGFRMIDFKNFYLLRHHSTRFDFIVYFAVVVTALLVNLIAAAGMGILLSIFIFLRDQVRQPVVRRKVTGNQFFSKKRRLPAEREILDRRGAEILAVELQGPLFFGTSDQLIDELEPHLGNCRYIILDMRRVHAVDYTAVHRLVQIEQTIRENRGVLIFTSVPLSLPSGLNVQKYLGHLGLIQSGRSIKYFNSLDDGIQWAEDQILDEEKKAAEGAEAPLHLSEINIFSGINGALIEKLLSCVQEKQYQPGQMIFSRGDKGRDIYFLRKGSVRIDLPLAGGISEHLATFCRGDFFGDMAFLVKGGRSANAVAEDDVLLYILSRSSFDELTAADPGLGEIVYQRLASALAERLRLTDIIIKALAEN